jgi:hypothetical protein
LICRSLNFNTLLTKKNSKYALTTVVTGFQEIWDIGKIKNGGTHADNLDIQEYNLFLFRDGTSNPPKLLRDLPDQNYLSPELRYVGLFIMALSLFSCLSFGMWVYVNRNLRIVLAAQPYFLYLLIFGAAATSLSIFFISTDENWGYTADELGRHCMAIVWLSYIGHITTYGALFSKLWRVNKVLQFSRRKISASHVAWPSAILMIISLALLTAWTAHDALQWVRVELDEVTGESIGQCDCDTMVYYIIALAVVMMIPSLLTCLMAWYVLSTADF